MGLTSRFSPKSRGRKSPAAGSSQEYTSFYNKAGSKPSSEDLLDMYGEFMIENSALVDFPIDDDDDEEDYDPATGSSWRPPAVNAEFADDYVENPRSLHGRAYNLLRGYADTDAMAPVADPLEEVKDEDEDEDEDKNEDDCESLGYELVPTNLDVLFDAEDPSLDADVPTTHEAPAPVVIISPSVVANQLKRVEDQMEADGFEVIPLPKGPTEVTLTRRNKHFSREHFSSAFNEQSSGERECKTQSYAHSGLMMSPNNLSVTSDSRGTNDAYDVEYLDRGDEDEWEAMFLPSSEEQYLDARDIQLWDPITRDLIIEVYETNTSIKTPTSSVTPNPGLTVETGVRNPFLGMSALLLRRVQRDPAGLARADERSELSFSSEMIEVDGNFQQFILSDKDPVSVKSLDISDTRLEGPLDSTGTADMEIRCVENLTPTCGVQFFEPTSQHQVGYTALNQLIKGQKGTDHALHRGEDDQFLDFEDMEVDLDNVLWADEFHFCRSANEYIAQESQGLLRVANAAEGDDIVAQTSSIKVIVNSGVIGHRNPKYLRPTLRLITSLEAIPEDEEERSPSSDSGSSADFGAHRDFVLPLQTRRPGFLDAEFEVDLESLSLFDPDPADIERLYFPHPIWYVYPDLSLTYPSSLDFFVPIIFVHEDRQQVFHEEDAIRIKNELLWEYHEPSEEFDGRCKELMHKCAFAMEALEGNVVNFVHWVLDRVQCGSFRAFDRMLDDATWAMDVLREAAPNSRILSELLSAVVLIEQEKSTMVTGRTHSEPPKVDAIWSWNLWGINPFGCPTSWETDYMVVLNHLLDASPSYPMVDDPYVPFSLVAAQAKYLEWTDDANAVDTLDPDYELLTFASKVSFTLLEHITDTCMVMERMTSEYIEEIRKGNHAFVDFLGQIITGLDYSHARFGLGGKTVAEVANEISLLHWAVSQTDPTQAQAPYFIPLLPKWHDSIESFNHDLRQGSEPSMQADDTLHHVDRFWKTAFRSMDKVMSVHDEVGLDTFHEDQLLEMEQLLWRLWMMALCEVRETMDLFAEKIHPSFLPTSNDLLSTSVAWWETKIYQAQRRLRLLQN